MTWEARILDGPHAGRHYLLVELPRFVTVADECACCGREHIAPQDPDRVAGGPVYELVERSCARAAREDGYGLAAYRHKGGDDELAGLLLEAETAGLRDLVTHHNCRCVILVDGVMLGRARDVSVRR